MKKLVTLLFLLTGTLYAQHTRYVIVVVIDGVRYTESLGDPAHQWIPRIWTALRPQGTIYTSYSNAGITESNPGHATIVTGVWQAITNDGATRPHTPTVFEYSRKSLGTGADKNFVVLGKTKLNILAFSDHPEYGPSFGASVVGAPLQNNDQLAADTLKRVLRTNHPTLAVLNLPNSDSVAHGDNWDGYLSSVRNADSLTYEIWNAVQNDSVMKGKTTMFVTNDHGRHTTAFSGHGDGCEGCRHLMLLAIGPDTPPGVIDSIPRKQVDIAPTIGVLLGFATPYATGNILSSAISTFSYAHDVLLSQPSRDSLRITAHVENPLGHALTVMVTLRDMLGVLIDSVALKDDGFHSDGAANDGMWGYMCAPGPEGTIRASIRIDDPAAGTSSNIPDVARFVFTRGAVIGIDASTTDLGRISNILPHRDTTFTVRNIGFGPDSITILLDPVNVIPETAVDVSPTSFFLAARDSQKVTFRIQPLLLASQYYQSIIIVQSKSAIGQASFTKSFLFEIVTAGAVTTSSQLPKKFDLGQNYPNPFNPKTVVRYQLPVVSSVRLVVYDVLGREVAVLVNERKEAGFHEVKFDAAELASGVYIYRLTAGRYVESRKMLMLK